ncbi:sigma 54-interacting transcriptional regulator, partial [Bacteroidota bacterium]
MADDGSIYLDDIDDIPINLQVKLLRVLQEHEFERVGGNDTIKIDVRVIASTKADLKQLVQEGRFREDLFYRLNIFPIHIAPLRERKTDIYVLINHFLKLLAPERNIKITDSAMDILTRYYWPGNIR